MKVVSIQKNIGSVRVLLSDSDDGLKIELNMPSDHELASQFTEGEELDINFIKDNITDDES